MYRGYAVGVAGIVAFMPAKQCARPTSRRIGQLQKFRIIGLDRSRQQLVLSDPNLHYDSTMAAAPQRDAAAGGSNSVATKRRPARSSEEAQRRQELTKVAEELRSVLALRGS